MRAGAESKFSTSLKDWDSRIVNGLNTLSRLPQMTPAEQAQMVQSVHAQFSEIRTAIWLAQQDLESVKEILDLRRSEARFKGVGMKLWPADVTAERLMYLGVALFGAASVSATVGAAVFGKGTTLLSIFLLVSAVVAFIMGLLGLANDQRQRWYYYCDQFGIPDKYPRRLRWALFDWLFPEPAGPAKVVPGPPPPEK